MDSGCIGLFLGEGYFLQAQHDENKNRRCEPTEPSRPHPPSRKPLQASAAAKHISTHAQVT